jgi:rhamnosyltransferase
LKVSVALLTKNGGARLAECVAALLAQDCADAFEILAIDSGSRDGSAELLRAQPRVRVVSIEPGDFQHGRTRNEAMRATTGELVAFLTQDAIPEPDWLRNLVAFMDAHQHIAGAFGHQLPHRDADALEAFEVGGHFESFRGGPREFRRLEGPAGDDARARQHFFSNVSSIIRRSAWEATPFPEVEFGEDQSWALAVQSAGGATGYAMEAVVRHSHAYDTLTLLRRRYDEARFMKRQFGYALMPTLGQATATARLHARLFREHLAPLPRGRSAGARLHALARAWASALGRYAGTRFAASEGALHRMLSLAERQRRA